MYDQPLYSIIAWVTCSSSLLCIMCQLTAHVVSLVPVSLMIHIIIPDGLPHTSQDIEGVVSSSGELFVVQARPQVL